MKWAVLFAALAGVILRWFATPVLQSNSGAQPDDITGVVACTLFGIISSLFARFWASRFLRHTDWGRRLSAIAYYGIAPFFAGAAITGIVLIIQNNGTVGWELLCRDVVVSAINFNLYSGCELSGDKTISSDPAANSG